MAKDLFQIGTERDIYLTMDLWALLSPRLTAKKSDKSLPKGDVSCTEKLNEGDINEAKVDF
jgi:hypothetical protein